MHFFFFCNFDVFFQSHWPTVKQSGATGFNYFFLDFSPLTFFFEWSNLTNINHQPVGCLLLADGIPESLKGWAVDIFPRATGQAQVPQIDTHTDRRFWSHLLLHDPTSVFFVLESPPKNVYKWYKIQVKSFEQSQRTQPYSRENMDCAYETINNMINKNNQTQMVIGLPAMFFFFQIWIFRYPPGNWHIPSKRYIWRWFSLSFPGFPGFSPRLRSAKSARAETLEGWQGGGVLRRLW